jgi:SnoaL-like polyketide cyclase
MRAIVANVEGDASDVSELFTHDVSGDSPATTARSREELAVEIDSRRDSFRQRDVTFRALDVNGDLARVEWVATGLHVGPFVLERNGIVVEPTGLRLRVRAVTVAKFRGNRICSWRSSWDDVTMMTATEAPSSD